MRKISSPRFDIIEDYIKRKKGHSTYRSWLLKYLVVNEFIKEDFTIIKNPNTYFDDGRNYDKDVLRFLDSTRHYSSVSRRTAMAMIKNWFKWNNIRFSPKVELSINDELRGAEPESDEKIPSRDEFKQILSYGTVKHKALFLTMISSGVRPNETVNINLNTGLFLEENPPRIIIPGFSTRTKKTRESFISSEAKHWIRQWLKVRERYLENVKCKSVNHRDYTKDERLFPFSVTNLIDMWNNLLEKAGFDKSYTNGTNRKRHLITPQKLRKYFKSQMLNQGVPFEIYEGLIGHKGGIEAVYRRMPRNQVLNWYLKGEPALLIFETPQNQEVIDNISNQLENLKSELNELNKFKEQLAPKVRVIDSETGLEMIDDDCNPVEVPNPNISDKTYKAWMEELDQFEKLVKEYGWKRAKIIWNMGFNEDNNKSIN